MGCYLGELKNGEKVIPLKKRDEQAIRDEVKSNPSGDFEAETSKRGTFMVDATMKEIGMKCEKCGNISEEVHVCNDIFGQFYICYECTTLKTIVDVKREVEIIRHARETKPT
jgi:uncharacterized protein (DUF2249 family)